MRRVVTSREGSVVLFDDSPPLQVDTEQAKAWEVWVADDTPPALAGGEDTARRPWSLEPPAPRGSAFRLIEFHPGSSSGMHATDTLDYVVVLDGAITMRTPEGDVVLEAGDVVVQRGAEHDWHNHTDRPCRVAVVLIAAES